MNLITIVVSATTLFGLFYLAASKSYCPDFKITRASLAECEGKSNADKFSNLPIITGAYCFNNGSYICKAFSGRFEFYFNSRTDEIIGPVEQSEYVDEFGYHKRVPVSYNVTGAINYVDKFINWATFFVKAQSGRKFNILSTKSFNWCAFTDSDWWPYKSSIKWRHYHIYFYNRQSCIFDTKNMRRQHFNTRFLQKSNLRIDLDYNPTIFAMEDSLASEKKIRLVKHKRQHWYEVTFDVIERPTKNISYFIDMKDTEEPPLKLNGTLNLFNRFTYRKYSDICINDAYIKRYGSSKNSQLVAHWCGLDEVEISDIPEPSWRMNPGKINYEVDLHNLPRHPLSAELFYDVHLEDESDWVKFAKDGYTFSATTTIPINDTAVRIIMLVSSFNTDEAGQFNEYYPTPILVDTIGVHQGVSEYGDDIWDIKRDYSRRVPDLNYIDDIAYLYKCKSLLVIMGPLYTELSPNNFSVQSTGYIGSILDLGIYELVNAFFNEPDTDILWIYHRTNYVTSVKYTCGDLVTGRKVSEKYYLRHGSSRPAVFHNAGETIYDYCEECFFKSLQIFRGSTKDPEAPNPLNYPLPNSPIPNPATENDSLFMWIIVGLGIIIILIMAIVCLITMRGRRRRARHQKEMTKLSGLTKTIRSNTSGTNHLDRKTGRSSLATQGEKADRIHPVLTLRSGIPSASSTVETRRSSMTSSSAPNEKLLKTSRSKYTGSSGSKSDRKSTSTHRSVYQAN